VISDFADSKVTVKKYELVETMKKNREEHRARFLKAQEAYRIEAIKVLDRTLADAREGKPFILTAVIGLTVPHEHTKDYDTVLRMLEMSVDDQVVISRKQFQEYVLDDWGWKGDFDRVSSTYGC
jgi:hypothetical protein